MDVLGLVLQELLELLLLVLVGKDLDQDLDLLQCQRVQIHSGFGRRERKRETEGSRERGGEREREGERESTDVKSTITDTIDSLSDNPPEVVGALCDLLSRDGHILAAVGVEDLFQVLPTVRLDAGLQVAPVARVSRLLGLQLELLFKFCKIELLNRGKSTQANSRRERGRERWE